MSHLPRRPGWRCDTCDGQWPCPPARARLAEAYRRDPVGVAMYLAAQMHAAMTDLAPATPPGLTPAGFHARFLAWVRTEGEARD